MSRTLHPHQVKALDGLRSSLMAGFRRPMLQAPTGFGKTVLAGAIVKGARAKGKRVLFVVPAISLIDQTVRSFWAEGITDIGVIQGQHPMTRPEAPVQVASIQTLQRRAIPPFDVVVVDEAHRWFEMLGQWMAAETWQKVPFIGLSATPWTRGLGKHYDDLIQVTTTAELIEAGYLSPFRVYAPSHPDLGKVRTVAGDYHEGDLSEAMNKPALVADVVTTWRQRGENRPTFVFAVDRAHAKHLQGEFEKAGIGCGYIDAYTKPDEREAMFRRFSAGEMRVIASVGCLTTGVDLDVRCIVLARPTKSEMLYVQIIGRGLRTAPGKADCLILDHSDTTLRMGFVTDIHHDHLDDGRERQKAEPRQKPEALPKECSACNFLKPAKTPKCPACGFKPERQSEIVCEDGQLVEMTSAKAVAKAKKETAEQQFIYAQLLHYARRKGHKTGWVNHRFEEMTGTKATYRLWGTPETEPTPSTLSWIKSRQIAYAKRRRPSYAAAAE
ncbi:Putative DNA repair helicase RadD [Methylorubrum aminovorans]|uniref:DNA repair helicase RadD n=1 Tax=Methylorubrum aminovorans TaxID=269069 RepID=A0ABQ4U8K4_9HYPH|nr:DEAD/DEAH box helicase [Methylorubrum aminovorans]GJE63730.1 Putative DNA repair helicase RadD [Methylorubrum aminovorans]GMA73659.1 helicase [Methylorubrum aminovorans]GMA79845.1 helicase [Methylorubrum aminovorans]